MDKVDMLGEREPAENDCLLLAVAGIEDHTQQNKKPTERSAESVAFGSTFNRSTTTI